MVVGADRVLHEMQRAARTQHPPHLGDSGNGIGDRAQAPGAQQGICCVVGHRQALTVESHHLDSNR
jgi:hypothetical protein